MPKRDFKTKAFLFTSYLSRAIVLLVSLALPSHAAVIEVTTLVDIDGVDGLCSLREAIIAANGNIAHGDCPTGTGFDEIFISPPGTVSLEENLPPIEESVLIRGLGSEGSAIDGGNLYEIFHLPGVAPGNGETLQVEGLTLQQGLADQGGAIYVGRNQRLDVTDCVLVHNSANLDGGAIRGDRAESITLRQSQFGHNNAGSGGAVALWIGNLEVSDSTFYENSAIQSLGGAIYALFPSVFTVHRSTFSSNSAATDGGGLAVVVADEFSLASSTLVGNLADSTLDGDGNGGGLSLAGAMLAELANNVLADNQDFSGAGEYCPDGSTKLGASVQSFGANVVSRHECLEPVFPLGSMTDQVGEASAPLDAELGPLTLNGGPTLTHFPAESSLLVDQGSCFAELTDQRGFSGYTGTRIVDRLGIPDFDDGCDVGAVEFGARKGPIFQDGFETGDPSRWSSVTP